MQYEYKKEVPMNGVITEDRLNELGAQGWGNYAVNNGVFYFKRQKDDNPTRVKAKQEESKKKGR